MAVFVEQTAPGDVIKTEIISAKKTYARGILKEIIQPSERRVKPFCPLFKACGGCQWQHIDYEEQLNAKKKIVEESLQKVGDIQVKDTIASSETREYRCKVQFPVQQTRVSKRFLAGYYAKGSHELINIKYCPVQPAIIDEITKYLREKSQQLELSAYDEKKNKGLIRHFVFRYSKTNKNLTLTIVTNAEKVSGQLEYLCKSVKNNFNEIEGVLVNFNTTKSNVILGKDSKLIAGKDYIEEQLDGKIFKISHDSFFQVNPLTATKMFSEVRKMIEERTSNPKILDIYAGSGSFSTFLSDIALEITAVEAGKSSVADGKDNLIKNNITNISYIEENADTAIPKLTKQGEIFDVVILDPPRKGCSKEVLEAIKELKPKYLIYVSCNPSTLARDFEILSEKYNAEFVQPVDMFCHTYHVESILISKLK